MKNWLSESIELATDGGLKLPQVEGYTSDRVMQLLNRLCAGLPDNEVYLEVGTYKGASFIGALHGTGATGFSVDNWIEYGTEKEARANVRKHLGADHEKRVLTGNCFDLFQTQSIPKVGVLFYDGAHGRDATWRAISSLYGLCSDEFCLIVDDWNFPAVRVGTMEALGELPLGGFEHYSLMTEGNGDVGSWWNGIGAFWIRKERTIEPIKRCFVPHDTLAVLTAAFGEPTYE